MKLTRHRIPAALLALLLCLGLASCVRPVDPPPSTAESTIDAAAIATTEAPTTTEATSAPTTTMAPTTAFEAATTNAPPVPAIQDSMAVEAQKLEDLPPPQAPPEEPAADSAALVVIPAGLPYAPILPSQYYSYNQLSEVQKGVYREMRACVESMQPSGYILQACADADLLTAYLALLTDFPQFFWLSRSFVHGADETGRIVYFQYRSLLHHADYIVTGEQAVGIAAKMKAAIAGIFSEMPGNLSEFERELWLHDWLCANAAYEDRAVRNPDSYMYAFSAYGAFVNNLAVCEGYARTLQLLLYCAGVQNTLVTGNTLRLSGRPDPNGHHMWNIVRIDGQWGYTDATWNDSGVTANRMSETSYRWFNIPRDELSYDHYVDHAFPLPEANSMENTWFAVKGRLLAEEQAAEAFVKALIVEAAAGDRRYVELMSAAPGAFNAQQLGRALNTVAARLEINGVLGGPIRRITIERHSTRYCLVYW